MCEEKYSFKDEHMLKIFNMSVNDNKIELSKPKRLEEVEHTKDLKYWYYHRIISYPTNDCFILKDKIQAQVELGVLCLNEEKKQVTTNMVSLQFGRELPK